MENYVEHDIKKKQKYQRIKLWQKQECINLLRKPVWKTDFRSRMLLCV